MKSKETSQKVDQRIEQYIQEMKDWMVESNNLSVEIVNSVFDLNKMQVDRLFRPHPETILGDDPAKWAEILGVSWGIIEEKELDFL